MRVLASYFDDFGCVMRFIAELALDCPHAISNSSCQAAELAVKSRKIDLFLYCSILDVVLSRTLL
jgi:hypothetical protein